jgi:hypothetical protein
MRRLWVVLSALAALGLVAGTRTLGGTTSTARTGEKPAMTTRRTPRSTRRAGVGIGAGPTQGQCPSPVPGRMQSVGNGTYTLEGMDTFTKDAPLGSLAPAKANQIVYTGDHGMRWTGYPDGWPSTYSGRAEGYQPSTVLSIHNGVLDFHLHNDAHGNPVGADPSPLPGGNRYQTFGAWSLCEKVSPADSHKLRDFHQAFLLWPRSARDWLWAEADYPEEDLDTLDFAGYAHFGGSGSQDVFDIQSVVPAFDSRRWHVYTLAWGPGFRSYYVDGRLVGTSTSQVWSRPERWQLQIEPLGTINDGDSGHVYLKWVWIGRLALRRP